MHNLSLKSLWKRGPAKGLSLFFVFYTHVSIGSQHISHVSSVRQFPSKYVLYNNDSLLRCTRWFYHISICVLNLDFLPETSILQSISNVARTWVGFVCHLLKENHNPKNFTFQFWNVLFLMQDKTYHRIRGYNQRCSGFARLKSLSLTEFAISRLWGKKGSG